MTYTSPYPMVSSYPSFIAESTSMIYHLPDNGEISRPVQRFVFQHTGMTEMRLGTALHHTHYGDDGPGVMLVRHRMFNLDAQAQHSGSTQPWVFHEDMAVPTDFAIRELLGALEPWEIQQQEKDDAAMQEWLDAGCPTDDPDDDITPIAAPVAVRVPVRCTGWPFPVAEPITGPAYGLGPADPTGDIDEIPFDF